MKQHDEKGRYIYVAGPYKSKSLQATNQYVRNMSDACNFLIDYGFFPFFPLLSHFWDLVATKREDEWLALSYAWIERCDIFTYLEDNGLSHGVVVEREIAFRLGIPIYSYGALRNILLGGKSIITLKRRTPNCDAISANHFSKG